MEPEDYKTNMLYIWNTVQYITPKLTIITHNNNVEIYVHEYDVLIYYSDGLMIDLDGKPYNIQNNKDLPEYVYWSTDMTNIFMIY